MQVLLGNLWVSKKPEIFIELSLIKTILTQVYVAAIGSPWGEHPERGVFKTTDGGKTWIKSLFINNKTGAADLVVDPSNPNKLIAAIVGTS